MQHNRRAFLVPKCREKGTCTLALNYLLSTSVVATVHKTRSSLYHRMKINRKTIAITAKVGQSIPTYLQRFTSAPRASRGLTTSNRP